MVLNWREVRPAQQADGLLSMDNKSVPRISVIVPTCHRNDLLAKCLDCLAPGVQTLPPEQYEVIVTDDGTRSTAEALVQGSYPWVRWVAGPRQGPAANRNNGARLAQGQWLAFTDDDCLPARNWLAAYADATTDKFLVYEGKTDCLEGVKSPLFQSPINLTGGYLWSCNFMIQSSLFHDVGEFQSDFAMPTIEDIDLHERLCQQGQQAKFVDAALVDHPARRKRAGWQSGKIYEALVQHWNKQGRYGHSPVAYLKHLKYHVYLLSRYGLHKDTFAAGYLLLTEALYVLPRILFWERKYRKQYYKQLSMVVG